MRTHRMWTIACCVAFFALPSGGCDSGGADVALDTSGGADVAQDTGGAVADTGGGAGGASVPADLMLLQCAWDAQCRGGGSVGGCLWRMATDEVFELAALLDLPALEAKRGCLAAATDCISYSDCMFADVATCLENGASCEGSVRVSCDWGMRASMDCGAYDATCNDAGAWAPCVYLEDPHERCFGDTWVAHEERGSDGDIFWVAHCDQIGMVCDPAASCVAPERIACESAGCDGAILNECPRGLVARHDCRAVHDDALCFADPDGQLRCGRSAADALCEEGCRCDGTVAECCPYGVPVRFDCAVLGLRCEAGGEAADCVP